MTYFKLVFVQLEAECDNASWLCFRDIICLTKADVEEANNLMIKQFSGEHTEYESSDSVAEMNTMQYLSNEHHAVSL